MWWWFIRSVLRDRCDIVASFWFDDDGNDGGGGAEYDKASSPGIFFKFLLVEGHDEIRCGM